MRVYTGLFGAVVLTLGGAAAAQEQTGEADRAAPVIKDGTIATIEMVPPAGRYTPLTGAQKFTYNVKRTFDAGALIRTSIAAGMDTAVNTPEPWGGGFAGYGDRFASKIGHRLTKHVIMAGAQMVMHDDPRKIPTAATGFWPRARKAVVNTYRIRHDDGVSTHFNYARLIAAYGSAFVSRTWHPAGYRSSGDALVNGTMTLGIDAGMSVVWEFWPDLKRSLFR